MHIKLEYIWLDGYQPEANLRSKTKVWDWQNTDNQEMPDFKMLPIWSFDGSSTQQAEGNSSDCLLKPVRIVHDPQRHNGYLVLCEVLNPDGSAHTSNRRSLISDNDEQNWFGFEQEYTLVQDNRPLGFPSNGFPNPQGEYYCGVGDGLVSGRDIIEEHLDICLEAGLSITGINAEVMLGQWEYQLFGKGAKRASDDLWLSRYLLHRITESTQISVEFHPKPVQGDWNGSGLHTNFSTKAMREQGGKALITKICETFKRRHQDHMTEYGSANDQRLTGLHETQNIKTFSYGVSDRGASIRIPIAVAQDDWKGYLEDRRPASNADPYRISKVIVDSLAMVKETV